MTEYTVKEIGHQWIVYADRLSIATCADEASALKLIAEDSAARRARRKTTVNDMKAFSSEVDTGSRQENASKTKGAFSSESLPRT